MSPRSPPGSGLVADIRYDPSTAEGGSLELPATGITIVPLGDAVLVAFSCEITGCSEDDVVFTPGGEGVGSLVVDDFSGGPVFEVRSRSATLPGTACPRAACF